MGVQLICCGHFHADFETTVGGVRCVGTSASYLTQFDLQVHTRPSLLSPRM